MLRTENDHTIMMLLFFAHVGHLADRHESSVWLLLLLLLIKTTSTARMYEGYIYMCVFVSQVWYFIFWRKRSGWPGVFLFSEVIHFEWLSENVWGSRKSGNNVMPFGEKSPWLAKKKLKETFGPPRWRGGFASLHRGSRRTPLHASQRVLDNHDHLLTSNAPVCWRRALVLYVHRAGWQHETRR